MGFRVEHGLGVFCCLVVALSSPTVMHTHSVIVILQDVMDQRTLPAGTYLRILMLQLLLFGFAALHDKIT